MFTLTLWSKSTTSVLSASKASAKEKPEGEFLDVRKPCRLARLRLGACKTEMKTSVASKKMKERRDTYAQTYIAIDIDPMSKHILAPILVSMGIKTIASKWTQPPTSSLLSKILTGNPLHALLVLLYRVFFLLRKMWVRL